MIDSSCPMPFGRYAGMRIAELPNEYLAMLTDVDSALHGWVQRRYPAVLVAAVAEWERRMAR